MRNFADFNPFALLIYFVSASGIAMLSVNPVIAALSVCGSLSLFFIRTGIKEPRFHLWAAAIFTATALVNPMLSHNGVTPLFIVNNNPVTLEALLYGIAAAAVLVSALYWFRSFSAVMTSDKLLYIFGAVSPKLALMLSMTLRYIPLFSIQARKINRAQTAFGLYKEDNAVDSIRGGSRIFSVMVTWALENGIVTADSMAARGYGVGRRTHFSIYRFTVSDAVFLAVILALTAVYIAGACTGALDFGYYPAVSAIKRSPLSVMSYFAYGLLAFLPSIIEGEEALRWKYSLSKI